MLSDKRSSKSLLWRLVVIVYFFNTESLILTNAQSKCFFLLNLSREKLI